jgi:hypothetical protein
MGNKGYLILLTFIKGAMAGVLLYYFLKVRGLEDLTNLPIYIIMAGITYIVCQLFSRKLSSIHHWWDWLYYIGLAAIMLPASFANLNWFSIALCLSQVGAIFLFIPLLVDVFFLLKN